MRNLWSHTLRSLGGISCLVMPGLMAFPQSADPITANPPTSHPAYKLCTIPLITDAACDGYDKVTAQAYAPPTRAECPGVIEKVVLQLDGKVKGTQFDRYGTLFLGAVELLRTSTPEPNPWGISWSVEKDVTRYLTLFMKAGNSARLSIPNNVDDTYDGVFYVNASLSFYGLPPDDDEDAGPISSPQLSTTTTTTTTTLRAPLKSSLRTRHHGKQAQAAPVPAQARVSSHASAQMPLVVPLLDPFAGGGSPWGPLSVIGTQSLGATIEWPASNVLHAYLDVYASNHQCEEFWYTNVPDEEASSLGFCGGGTYRELHVYVNGLLAGIAYPNLVIYTGGINPLLWRPLTGIMSFDMGPYRFDLTPFVGVLNAEGSADVSISVLGNNELGGGLWYVNGVLLAYVEEALAGQVIGGALLGAGDGGARTKLTRKSQGDTFTFRESGAHHFNVSGRLDFPNGTSVVASVSTSLSASNVNHIGPTVQVSHGLLRSETNVSMGRATLQSVEQWPYNISSSYAEDETTMDMAAMVKVSFERTLEVASPKVAAGGGGAQGRGEAGGGSGNSSSGAKFHVRWSNDHSAAAAYNRSLDRQHTYTQEGNATEVFGIATSTQGACYVRELHASDGEVEMDKGKYACTLPAGLSFCNYHICPSADLRPSKVTVRPQGGGGGGGNERNGALFSGGQQASGQQGGEGGSRQAVLRLPGRNPLQRASANRKVTR